MINLLPAVRQRLTVFLSTASPVLKINMVRLLILLFISLSSTTLQSQPPGQICSIVQVTQSSGQPGDTVWLEVRGSFPGDLLSIQFMLSWDSAQLAFAKLDLFGSDLYAAPNNFNTMKPGRILFGWFDINGAGLATPSDALLFKIGFAFQPGAADFNPVKAGGTPFYIFEGVVTPFVYLPENCASGGIYKSPMPADAPAITGICIDNAGCNPNFAFGGADIDVSGGTPPYQFAWQSAQGQIISTTEDLKNIAPGKYIVTVTDQNGRSTSAIAEIGTTQSDMNVQAIIKDDPCQKKEGGIDLFVSGGKPPYLYQWSVGNVTGASASGLPAGNYTVTITDGAGCSTMRGYNVPGFPPMIVDAQITRPSCGSPVLPGKIALSTWFGNAPFSYTWNVAGEKGASLNNIPSGIYTVTITDSKGCLEERTYALSDLETDGWTVWQNTFCDHTAGPGQILLFIDGGNSVQWPLNTHWSTGATHTLNGSPNLSVIDSLHSLPDGEYSVILEDAAGCRKSVGNITTDCETQLTYDGKTCFQLRIGSASAQPGETVCVSVTAEQFIGIRRIESSIRWDTANLVYQGIYSTGLPPALSAQTFTSGYARVKWALPNDFPEDGISLPDGTTLYQLCFLVKPDAAPGYTAIRFGPDYYGAGTFQIKTLEPFYLGVLGFEGEIAIGGAVPERLHLNACATLPNCANDVRTDYTLDISNGTPPYTVQWNTTDGLQTGTVDDLKYLRAGTRYVTISDQNGKSAAAALTQFAGFGNHTCVWPGDADDNNAVNHYDLLYLGYAFGSSGLQRLEQGTNWQGYWQGVFPGFDWGITTPRRHIDFSNMDCDGNGQVNAQDVNILLQHWGKVIRPDFDDPFMPPPLPQDVNSTSFSVFIQPDTTDTDSLNLTIQAGTFDAPANNINGLAFSIFYDTAAIQAGTLQFIPIHSWMGHPDSTLLWVQKNYPEQGRLDVAISRKGIQPQSGFGPVGFLQGLLTDNMLRPVYNQPEDLTGGDSTRITMLRTGNLVAMSDQEQILASQGMETPLVIVQEIITGTNQPAYGAIDAQIRPNPTRDYATVICRAAPIEQLEIITANGTAVQMIAGVGLTQTRIDTSNLAQGLYWIRVRTRAGSVWLKLSVHR